MGIFGTSKDNLLKAAKRGDVAMVQRCLEAAGDIHATDWAGYTALHIAAKKGHVKVALQLLHAGVPVDEVASADQTPLQTAAEFGQTKVVEQLLLAGASVKAATGDYGWTPLHYAAYEGHLEVVEQLLLAGAAASAIDKKGKAPADVCCTSLLSNDTKYDILDALNAADVTPEELAGTGVGAHQMQRGLDDLQARDLFKAAKAGNVALVQRCLDAGVDISCKDWAGDTPLHVAAKSGRLRVVQLLLSAGAEVDADSVHDNRQTPLHGAAANGKLAVVRELLQAGASLTTRDALGETPLHSAVSSGEVEVVKELLAAGAAPNATTTSGKTPAEMWWSLLLVSKANRDAIVAALEAAVKAQQAKAEVSTPPVDAPRGSPWVEAARNMPNGAVDCRHLHVFISHAGDSSFAQQLHNMLQNHFGMKAFLDEESLFPGGDALPQMRRAMETSHIGLLLLSWEFLEREATMDELRCLLELHQRNRIILLPVFLRLTVEDCFTALTGESQRICGISGIRHAGEPTKVPGGHLGAPKTEQETTLEIACKLCDLIYGDAAVERYQQGVGQMAESAPLLPSL